MGNDVKTAILGENFSTASHRLRKNVMHSILVRIGEDRCFRCGEQILTPADLSIEHKVQWKTPEQFWDISNIAFSHFRCNSGSGTRYTNHGVAGYRVRGCRCEVCAKANSRICKTYRDKKQRSLSVGDSARIATND